MTIHVINNDPVAAQAEKPAGDSVVAPSVPVAEKPAEQKEPSTPDTEETEAKKEEEGEASADAAEDSDESDANEGDAERPKKKSGSQRRKERAERAEAEAARARAEAEHWRTMALKGAGEPKAETPKVEPAKQSDAGKPIPDSFETHAEYVEALTDWKLEQRESARKAADAKAALEAEHASLMKTHLERLKAFKEKADDFDDVVSEVVNLPMSTIVENILLKSSNGPEMLYELAQDPKEFERVNRLSPTDAALALGELRAKLLSANASGVSKQESKKTTHAPKPIAPLGGGKAAPEKSISDPQLSQAQYEAIRRKQLAARKAAW